MDESLWATALNDIADFTGSHAATFWVLDSSAAPLLPTFIQINLDPVLIREYLDGMAEIDPTVQYLVAHPNQAIVHDGLVISERDKNRHPYYDWHHRYSETRFRLIGQMSPAPGLQAGVALHRERHAGRYEPYDINQFRLLHAHLERALAIGFRLGTLGTMQQASLDLLEHIPAAAFLLGERLQVVYQNQKAAAICAAADGIRLKNAMLTPTSKTDDERLQRLLAEVCFSRAPWLQTAAATVGTMTVARPSGKRPYVLHIAPVTRHTPQLAALRPIAWVVVSDPETEPSLPSAQLRAAFGLTEAEARLASLIGAGEALRSAADKLGITYGTARARLAAIFEKTQTHRQGQLIKVLTAAVSPLV
jgi:DNA-binding CsgD family transcriptional regulator